MANQTYSSIKCGETTQSVAFALMQTVLLGEMEIKSKQDILDLYTECLARTADRAGAKKKHKDKDKK